MNRASLAMFGLLSACGPVVGEQDGGGMAGETTGAPSSQSETGASGDATTGPGSSTTPADGSTSIDSTTTDDDDGTDDGIFLGKTDLICFTHCTPPECSTWEQDCGEGFKCVPWANDGGNTWNANRCTPIDPTPALVGEPCVADGNGASGVDDCEAGSICWGVDPVTLEGECVAMCAGTEDAPVCPGTRQCVQAFDETVNICVVACDPLEPSCSDDEACVWAGVHSPNPAFACMPTPPFERGQYGDDCESDALQTCDSGLVCVIADHVPGCASTSCCTLLGDIDAPPACPDPEQSCLPFERESPEHCVCLVPT